MFKNLFEPQAVLGKKHGKSVHILTECLNLRY